MKSCLKSLYNYMKIPFEEAVETVTTEEFEETLKNEIQTALFQNRTLAEVEAIEKNDVVTLSSESDFPRFHKPELTLTVGLNLFHKEFEEALLGHRVGDAFTVTAEGHTASVAVKGCKRLTVPQLDDVFVKKLNLPGVENVEQYNEYLREKYKEFYRTEYVSWYASQLFSETCEKSQWKIDEEEREEFYRKWSEIQREDREFHHVTMLENYEGEQEEMEREEALNILQFCLVYCFFYGEDDRAYTLDLSDSEKLNEIKGRVMAPFERYLNDKVRVVFEEES